MVGILALVARADCEQAQGAQVLHQLEASKVRTLLELERQFAPRPAERGEVFVPGGYQHPLALYDALLSAGGGEGR